jgi:hypothetical protein
MTQRASGNRIIPLLTGILCASIACLASASASEDPPGWKYTVTPYLWMPAFEGDVGVGPVSAPVDAAFSDYMGDLAGALLLLGEARHGRAVVLVDGIWMRLKDEVKPGRDALSMVDVQLDMVLLEAGVGYDVISTEQNQLLVLAGARYVDMTVEADLKVNVAAAEAKTQQVFDQTVEAVETKVKREVQSKKGAIADSLPRVRPREVADRVAEEILDLGVGDPVAVEVASPFQSRGQSLDLAEEQRAYAEALQRAVAERAAGVIESELTPIERLDPDLVKRAIGKAASESVDTLKRNISSTARRELEQAEANLVAAVGAGVEQLGNEEFTSSTDWVDPFVGARLTSRLTEQAYGVIYGDIGGFGVGSELTWQAFAGLGWRLNPQVTMEAGYRYLAIDYEEGELDVNIDLKGFVLGVGYSF